jgi:hypothetical protein
MAVRRRAMEYRSEHVWGDLPVVHVSVGGRQADGRYRLGRARGVIALGDVAIGLVAVGGVAVGLLALGGVAVGLLALGGGGGRAAGGRRGRGRAGGGRGGGDGADAVGALTVGLVGAGPRPPVGSATRRESVAEGSRPGSTRPAPSADGAPT